MIDFPFNTNCAYCG